MSQAICPKHGPFDGPVCPTCRAYAEHEAGGGPTPTAQRREEQPMMRSIRRETDPELGIPYAYVDRGKGEPTPRHNMVVGAIQVALGVRPHSTEWLELADIWAYRWESRGTVAGKSGPDMWSERIDAAIADEAALWGPNARIR